MARLKAVRWERVRNVMIIVSFILGLVIGGYTMVLAKRQSDATQASLQRSQTTSCKGAKSALHQWERTLEILADNTPTHGQSTAFIDFHDKTIELYTNRRDKICHLSRGS